VHDEGTEASAPAGRAEAFRWAREAMRRNADSMAREEALRYPPPPSSQPVEPPEPAPGPAEPVVDSPLQPTFDVQWREIDDARRELLAEWSRLSKARERIESLYEHLDEMRNQLEVERRQLVAQSERMWIDRYQPVRLNDRPWRDAAAHVLEAAVIVRATVAQRAPELMARLRGRAQRGALIARRRELPPGRSS
jgi:hypothetical protein